MGVEDPSGFSAALLTTLVLAAGLLVACSSPAPVRQEAQTAGQASFGGPGPTGPHGTVTVQPGNGGYTVRVEASGLVPGRTYLLHLHRGRCVGPGTVQSRYDLPPLRADAQGHGVVAALVAHGPPAGPGTVLHVHDGDVPGSPEYRQVQCTPLPG